jgi:hypothetical protein
VVISSTCGGNSSKFDARRHAFITAANKVKNCSILMMKVPFQANLRLCLWKETIVVLAASVYAGKSFFVKKAHKIYFVAIFSSFPLSTGFGRWQY